MDTETTVTDAVETVASNLPANKTVIIVTAAVITTAAATVLAMKLKDKVKARIDAMRADAESQTD